jgi:hypothetical protein
MEKTIKNIWIHDDNAPCEKAFILNHSVHPEGLDVQRIRFNADGEYTPRPDSGHIVSVLKGGCHLIQSDAADRPLYIQSGIHLYLPPGRPHRLQLQAGAELLTVSGASAAQARGDQLLLRDEQFLSACAAGSQALRWILTPQYLSRRIFLHHDQTLLSKSGHPVSWFRTTMFDVSGLPVNDEGLPVFKMAYHSRTEFNVCYEVKGAARVRMALHPYKDRRQAWDRWLPIDSDTTYHLNESETSPEAEWFYNDTSGEKQYLRNKHEVSVVDGYVTLFCLFDPAPTGIEKHRQGEYSDYEPLASVIGTDLYNAHIKDLAEYDAMVDLLSLAKAAGRLEEHKGSAAWQTYLAGRAAQHAFEAKLYNTLREEALGRSRVIAPWMQEREYRGATA